MTLKQETITITEVVTLGMAIETFLNVDTVGKSSKTRRWYEQRLVLFAQKIDIGRALVSVLEVDLIDWYRDLEKSSLSPDTKHGYVRAVRKFFKFLHQREIIPVDVARDLKLPKLPKRARKGIADENVIAILEAAKDNPRDYALLNFLESTNARRGGIASLKLSDLSLELPEPLCRRVVLHEKGDKDRVAVMSCEAFRALTNWLSSRKIESEFVFTTPQGSPLTPEGVSEIIDRYKIRLGLKGNCSPHQWRHRWCRKRLQDGMPLAQVSQLAGHKSIAVTADYYGTFAVNELHEAYDRYYKPPSKQ